jgi:hypothetical protein
MRDISLLSLRKYLVDDLDIFDARKWSGSVVKVNTQNKNYDSGFYLMLHMIHHGTEDVYGIDEDMVMKYRKSFAVSLLCDQENKVKLCPGGTSSSMAESSYNSPIIASTHPPCSKPPHLSPVIEPSI